MQLMKVSIVLSDGSYINPQQYMSPSNLFSGGEDIKLKYLRWASAQPDDDLEGRDVLVSGKEYAVGHRRYDLSSGYALKVKLTPNNILVPLLRKARGKETEVTRDRNGFPSNEYWPIVVRIWNDDIFVPAAKENIVEEAMEHLDNINESFDLTDTEE